MYILMHLFYNEILDNGISIKCLKSVYFGVETFYGFNEIFIVFDL